MQLEHRGPCQLENHCHASGTLNPAVPEMTETGRVFENQFDLRSFYLLVCIFHFSAWEMRLGVRFTFFSAWLSSCHFTALSVGPADGTYFSLKKQHPHNFSSNSCPKNK